MLSEEVLKNKLVLIKEIFRIKDILIDLRDNQEVIECDDGDDVCNYFDHIIDACDSLIGKINKVE
jgi:hypothetical protein